MLGYHPPGPDPPGPDPLLGSRHPLGKQTPGYGQRAAGTHPTGMHSCLDKISSFSFANFKSFNVGGINPGCCWFCVKYTDLKWVNSKLKCVLWFKLKCACFTSKENIFKINTLKGSILRGIFEKGILEEIFSMIIFAKHMKILKLKKFCF